MLCSLLWFSCPKMMTRPGLDLILHRNGFQVINDDFLEEGGVMADNSYLTHSS